MPDISFEDIFDVVKLIPKGRVSTYGAIAAYLGHKRGARLVGWALNQPGVKNGVPAQRVVNRNGLLSGKHHFETPTLMEELLTQEGVKVVDDQVQDFKTLFWDPNENLL